MFRPRLGSTLALSLLALVFSGLGYWQIQRKAEKQLLFDGFENAPVMELAQALREDRRFARIEAYGRFDANRHFLVDNRMLNGRAGVHVLTPFTFGDGRTILVNRGWLPMPPDRSRLPDVPTDDRPATIRGRLNVLASEGPRLGDADRLDSPNWPQLVTYLDQEPLGAALGTPLPEWLVQLDADADGGFDGRQWKAAVMGPEIHGAYALQWFALSAAAVIIWFTLGYREADRRKKESSR